MGDHELMRAMAGGRPEALNVIVRRHQRSVLDLAYRFLGHWDLAEDICQEAFLRVFGAAPTYQPTARFSTWLYRIVANLCWDRRRRSARTPLPLSGIDVPTDAADPSVDIERAERREQVRRAVAGLPDRQRMILVMHRYSGLSHREIAESTGWSMRAVESCLVRAYRHLRGSLSDLKEI